MRKDVNEIVNRFKKFQGKIQGLLKDGSLIEEARKAADDRKRQIKKLVQGDVKKVRVFIEKERKELDRLQKRIPQEVKKLKRYVKTQKTELEKLLKMTKDATKKAGAKTGKKSTPKKKTARKKSTSNKTTSSGGPTRGL